MGKDWGEREREMLKGNREGGERRMGRSWGGRRREDGWAEEGGMLKEDGEEIKERRRS